MQAVDARHTRITIILLLETFGVYALIIGATLAAADAGWSWTLPLLVVANGVWLDRVYVVAHEASHGKLFPRHRWLNDALGSALLWPLAVPLAVFRKIHAFHHGYNRRDHASAALDVVVRSAAPSAVARLYHRAVWVVCVFGGGFFVHSIATILIFLVVPGSWARRISPAFAGWPPARRASAWLEFLLGLGIHAAVIGGGGWRVWILVLGAPMLVFAWLWSLLLYVYHYRTSFGREVGYNVRSLPRRPFFSWLLLNFNEHVTHHSDPRIPWYALPERRRALPESHRENENVATLWAAVRQQWQGPTIVVRAPAGSARARESA